MNTVVVDHEKLAFGLERGIGRASNVWMHVAPERRLRESVCGFAAAGIAHYARRVDLPVTLAVMKPKLPFDLSMRHALPLIGESTDPTVVDATYTQFLAYAGLTNYFEELEGGKYFPDQKILDFKLSETQSAADQVIAQATEFLESATVSSDESARILSKAPLYGARTNYVRATYERIYDLSQRHPWRAPDAARPLESLIVANEIPDGSITIQ